MLAWGTAWRSLGLQSRCFTNLVQKRHELHRFSTIGFLNSATESSPWKHDFHDVATVLRAASSEPVSVTVLAVIRTIRKQKKHAFVKLGDGSTTKELQVLLSPMLSEGLATGTSVQISGLLQPCPPGLQQSHELHADKVKIIGRSDPETYPIQKKYHTTEFLRTLPHLRLRTPWNGLLSRLRSKVDYLCSEWFEENEFVRAHPPVITSSDCEGAGEVFTVTPASEGPKDAVTFFRTPKFLTVSSQLHLEAYVHAHRAVWSLGPTFRAEKSVTPRHLSEFYMLEAEIQTESLTQVMDILESLLRHILSRLASSSLSEEILSHHNTASPESESHITGSALESRWQALLKPQSYPRITYTEAISYLQASHLKNPHLFTIPAEWGNSLSLEHEKYLTSSIGQGLTPIFVTDYPTNIKPFYMLPSELTADRQTCASFDLLLPDIAELAGGSLRQHDTSALLEAMHHKGVSSLEWYVSLREHGSIPHGGFGLGFDRLLCYIAGEENVREVTGWPRWVGRCDG